MAGRNTPILRVFFEGLTTDLTGLEQREAVLEGFNLWSEVIDLYVVEVCNLNEADIVVLFGAGNHGPHGCFGLGNFDGVGGVLAHNLGGPAPNNCGAIAGDTHFDDAEAWTTAVRLNDQQPIDLITVAAHEFGHCLGLFHTTVAGSLMSAFYTGSQRFLGPDDIAGAQAIYGTKDELITGPNTVCQSGNTYSSANLPNWVQLEWSVEPENRFSVDNGNGATFFTGAATSATQGTGSISVAVMTECGVTDLSHKDVWLGAPRVSGVIEKQAGDVQGCTSPTATAPLSSSWWCSTSRTHIA